MTQKLDQRTTASVVGITLGLWHLLWSLFVATGIAQPFLDFIFKLHMITPPYQVGPFSLLYAAGLIILTSGIGYVLGYAFASIWNYRMKR